MGGGVVNGDTVDDVEAFDVEHVAGPPWKNDTVEDEGPSEETVRARR